MAGEMVQLRNFSEAELLFGDDETKSILRFFFRADRQQIDSLEPTREIRNLAQGLLVAAVDVSYAMGWVEQTFRWVANPGVGLKQALQKLARRAARHWFEHLKNQSLSEARIYERVRDQLARNFRSPFQIMIQAKLDGMKTPPVKRVVLIHYDSFDTHGQAWG